MLRMRSEAPQGLRWGLLSLAAITAIIAVTEPADARSRRRQAAPAYSPPYAAIVLDANSGAVLHASNPDALRHPASLTKVMTLYMLFERLESGALNLDSPLKISEHAAGQSPTKLGLKEGSTIRVEDAIQGMVTRSANDAAAVVAENLAGSEEEFGRQMTRKARALGMSRTVYRNASGLPDSQQVTTARDQAILGRAVQEHFPQYYKYFQTRTFTYRGQRIGNHNRLLGKLEGVDGIKTGFTRASGFNLITSVHRDKRYIIAVVLGGTSGGARDARMRQLVTTHIREASVKRTAPMIAKAPVRPEPKVAARSAGGMALASASSTPVALAREPVAHPMRVDAAAGSNDPIRPLQVKTVSVKPGVTRTASAGPLHLPSAPPPQAAPPETIKAQTPPPVAARAGLLGVLPVRTATSSVREAIPEPAPQPTPVAVTASTPAPAQAKAQPRSGWIVQVGALPSETEAKQRLATVKTKAGRHLAAAEPFTEAVHKGSTTLYRARFAGLDKGQAEATCKFLKRNDVDCLAIKN
jgi:D-alanyl-D-alanine carboxypeptidase